MKNPDTRCASCGSFGPAAEYHPVAYCALFKVLGSSKAARLSLNEVLDHGRALERAGKPNNTPINVTLTPPKRKLKEELK